MTRKKVTLAYIRNDSERKASYKKRKKGLMKKVSELSTLCGVEACAIVYSQYDPEPVVWPSREEAEAVLSRFRRLSEMDQTRKMLNQESFTRQRIKKAEDQLRRLQKENKRRHLENFMFQCLAGMASLDAFDLRDAAEMAWVVNQTLRDIDSRMEALRVAGPDPPHPSPPPPPPVTLPEPVYVPAPPLPPQEDQQSGWELMAPPYLTLGEDINIESFPWNLVDSPTGAGSGGGLGWDHEMVLPHPYIFKHGCDQAGPSGHK